MRMSEPPLQIRSEWVHLRYDEAITMREVYGFGGTQGSINLEGIRLIPQGRHSRTLLVFMHPASTLQLLPFPRALAQAGIHVLCAGSRYARNDTFAAVCDRTPDICLLGIVEY